jgi:hypothetical protein
MFCGYRIIKLWGLGAFCGYRTINLREWGMFCGYRAIKLWGLVCSVDIGL